MNVGRTGSSEAVYFELAAPAQRRLRGRAKAPCTVSRAARVIPCSKLQMIAVETATSVSGSGSFAIESSQQQSGPCPLCTGDDKPATNYLAFVKLAYEFTPQLVCA